MPEPIKPTKRKITLSPEIAAVVTPEAIEAAQEQIDKPKKRNTAWKGLEYAIADALKLAGFKKAKRVPKTDQLVAMSQARELPDVYVPEAPFMMLDGKYSSQKGAKGWDKVESLFLECQAKYAVKIEDRFAMVTQKAGSRHKIVHLNLDWFAELCSKAYLGGKTSDQWTCPSCKQPTLDTKALGMGQEIHTCLTCTLQFITPVGTRPNA